MAFNDLFGGKFKSQFTIDSKDGLLTGVTKDSTGAALASCVVQSFVTSTGKLATTTTSDGSGNYRISVPAAVMTFCVAYKPGSPDVAGTTVNTLVGAGGY